MLLQRFNLIYNSLIINQLQRLLKVNENAK
jgi:hypothetical protein